MSYRIGIRELPPVTVLAVREACAHEEVGQTIGRALEELADCLRTAGAQASAPPFVMYRDAIGAGGPIDLEVCMPVAPPVVGSGRVTARELPAVTAASTIHLGPYDAEGAAYDALLEWMGEHGHGPVGPPRETYEVGPADTDDPAALRTRIDWPVR